jgi:hypothetical protein
VERAALEKAPEELRIQAATKAVADGWAKCRDVPFPLYGKEAEVIAIEVLAALKALPAGGESFQQRVQPWMMACFGPEISADKLERCDRFIEEALELCQAGDYPKDRAHALVDYVYGRPQGDINQEVGGVMVTLGLRYGSVGPAWQRLALRLTGVEFRFDTTLARILRYGMGG